jgi:hypothetical protein
VHESELVQELSVKRLEADKAEKARITDAVSAAQVSHHLNAGDLYQTFILQASITSKTSDMLDVLRLRSLLAAGELESFSESAAILAAGGVLLSENSESRQAVLNGFLSGAGEFEGVPCTYSNYRSLYVPKIYCYL